MRKHFRYGWYLIRHKWWVFYAGASLGVHPLRLLLHDWSKFTPREWVAYAAYFNSEKTEAIEHAFDRAWLSHIHRNPHHWNHWIISYQGDIKALKMPKKYVYEMVADWLGAGRVQTGRWAVGEWYQKNKDKIYLHPDTRALVEWLLVTEGHMTVDEYLSARAS